MYQVLYRKWRPRVFEDVVGQEHVSRTLKNEIISGHIAHAYLFTGSRGTGKTSCAKIFALAVNCKNPIDGSPCGECDICKEAATGNLLDISEIDAASNNGVENIRAIKEETFLVPSVCRYRVYIIDEAHMLSNQAFNAFLKILEEPPKHVIFILATTEPHKIPATILSRCQRFEFHRISNEVMAKRISYICEKENVKIDDESVNIIVNSADGAMRDALSLLDRCMSCGGESLTSKQIEDILGVTDKESVASIFKCIQDKKADEALKIVDNLYKTSKSMLGLCEGLLEMFRCKMISEVSNGNVGELLDYILDCMDCLVEAYKRMCGGVNPRIEIEVTITKLCYGLFKSEKIYKKVEPRTNLDKSNKESVSVDKSKITRGDKTDNTDKGIIKSSESDLEEFKEWSKVIKLINESTKSKSMSLAFKDSKAYKDGDFILIDSNKSLAFELLRESANKEEMRNAIKSVTGKTYKLGPYKRKPEKVKEIDPLDEFVNKTRKQGVHVEYE